MKVPALPATTQQTFRTTHNSKYNSSRKAVETLTDTVFTQKLLSNKTYYNALKDNVFMNPQKPIYHKERIATTSRTDQRVNSFVSPDSKQGQRA